MVHMGFALRALSSFSGLCRPLRELTNRDQPQGGRSCTQYTAASCSLQASCAVEDAQTAATPQPRPGGRPTATVRPLRVIMRQQDSGACRLVISGRMADVCAELDRLALPH